jgi:hypothetical protein
MLSPYGIIPNIEDENDISVESETNYYVKKDEEAGLGNINLVQIKQNIENGDSEEIYEDENDKKKNVLKYTSVYNIEDDTKK